ncbi:oxidoreductase-related [Holotrichia oblita]|nr:oxidoreductase-related [Holotrichia oblita]
MAEKLYYETFERMEDFMAKAFVAAGVPLEDAKTCAAVLIESDKRGIDSHGVGRLKPIYLDRIKEGIQNTITNFEIVREGPTTAVVDGHDGMGHVIGVKSMQLAINKAKKYGMGMVAVRNSTHYGIAGYYSIMAAKEGLIGITGTNARPSIAPTFGVENMLGTNPLTIGFPTDEDFPFVLDCATSISQRGKIEHYSRLGKQMPDGWVVDRNGLPVTDPDQALKGFGDGSCALAPLGGIGEDLAGYKGYGYATVVEVLSSALQAGYFLKALNGFDQDGHKRPYHLGHFFIAIDINAFIDVDSFKHTAGEILRQLRASQKAVGSDAIYTAGEKEYLAFLERSNQGIPMNAAGDGMTNHQELVKEITQELYKDNNVLALILYGSVARHEESANSDIDLLVITNENYLQKRHVMRNGIIVEFVEMPLEFLQKFILKKEIPMLFALTEGIILFDKISATEQLIADASKILKNGPPANIKWEDEGYRTKKRSDLTEIYKDLLDVDDEIAFNYIASLLITSAIPMLIEINNLWHQTRKKTINYLKSQCSNGYKYIEILLNPECSLLEKRDAAEKLIKYLFNQYGGILEGDVVIFKKNNI